MTGATRLALTPCDEEEEEGQYEYELNAASSDKNQSSKSSWDENSSPSIYDDQCGSVSRFTSPKSAIDVFIQHFVDAFSPEVDIASGRAGALRAAADIRMFSPMITNAFEAVSLTFSGQRIQDVHIELTGMRLYPRSLRMLQNALRDPERSRAEATLATVVLFLAFESIKRTSDVAVAAHIRGAVRLIEHRGPENHRDGVAHLLFTELRPYWVFGALMDRKPTVFNEPAWKTVPWSAGTTKKDLLHHLLDLAVEIPELLCHHDELVAAKRNRHVGKAELRAKQAHLWKNIQGLSNRFLQWKKDWVDCYPSGPPRETIEPQGQDEFPVFRCYDLQTKKFIAPPTLVYPDLRLQQTMSTYFAMRLLLATIDTRPKGAVTTAEKYQLACDIARSMEFYIRNAAGNMINRLAFPVRFAWDAFPPGGIERSFMSKVFLLVEQRHALRLWGSSMPELSSRVGFSP